MSDILLSRRFLPDEEYVLSAGLQRKRTQVDCGTSLEQGRGLFERTTAGKLFQTTGSLPNTNSKVNPAGYFARIIAFVLAIPAKRSL
jgi:hypothetical protein